jgi:hypothetical protein
VRALQSLNALHFKSTPNQARAQPKINLNQSTPIKVPTPIGCEFLKSGAGFPTRGAHYTE